MSPNSAETSAGICLRRARRLGAHFSRLLSFLLLASSVRAQGGLHDWNQAPALASGVHLAQTRITTPRNTDVYCVRIDSQNPRVRFSTTDSTPACASSSFETLRKTTREFLADRRLEGLPMVAAINADAFSPFPVPWDQESCTNLEGLAVSEGAVVSPASGSPTFVVFDDRSTSLTNTNTGTDTTEFETAVSGFEFVLLNGNSVGIGPNLHPRTGIGLSLNRRYVFWVVIDGRTAASEGATTDELGEWLRHFGAWTGINMDGGGSSAMARHDAAAPGDGNVLVNQPVGEGSGNLVPSERNNGNNIGVYVLTFNDALRWSEFE